MEYELKQHIYSVTNDSLDGEELDNSSLEEVKKQCRDFFNEVYQKRKDDAKEGGLQAAILVSPQKFGAKICEKDGLAPHEYTLKDLMSFFKNKPFISPEEPDYQKLTLPYEIEYLDTHARFRIVSGVNEMSVYLFYNGVPNPWMKAVIDVVLEQCKKMREDICYTSVKVGVNYKMFFVDPDEITDKQMEEIQQTLAYRHQPKGTIHV